MFQKMIAMIQGKGKKLVFPEGNDVRILEAASRLAAEGLMTPILLGDPAEIEAKAKEAGFSLAGVEVVNPVGHPRFDEMVATLVELRKGKMTDAECREALQKTNYFGTMMVKMGLADGLLGGATYSTADTVRPALQIVKTKPGYKLVSSCFIMNRPGKNGDERLAMADCAINLDPTAEELVEIAVETAHTARLFDMEPKLAMLSFSTKGSGKGDSADKMREATRLLAEAKPDFDFDGEFQFDAAVAPEVAKTKAPDSKVAGTANTFIFPNIDSGNIGYKIAQRLGGFEAFGPILLGLAAPINDLSRGCNADEVYKMAIITAASSV